MTEPKLIKYFTPKAILNLLVILGFVVFMTTMLTFLGKEIKDQTDVITTNRAKINTRIVSLAQLAELREDATKIQVPLIALESLLPTRDELISFPTYVRNLATEHGVSSSFSFSGSETPATPESAGNTRFGLEIIGPYQNIIDFIEVFENGELLVKLGSIDISSQGDGAFRGNTGGVIFFRD